VLPKQIADLLLSSLPVQYAEPQLIALDAAEIDRITDFQWSPYYSGTDIITALASDPIPAGAHCHELLARLIRTFLVPGADVLPRIEDQSVVTECVSGVEDLRRYFGFHSSVRP
jgi:hypothetical protein